MSRTCELTKKKPLFGHNVSHSNRKTQKKFKPNLFKLSLASDKLKMSFKLRITPHALRTIEKKGGLDNYLLSVKSSLLSSKALDIRKKLLKKNKINTE